MTCRNCNEDLIGDGYRSPMHCPNITDEQEVELNYREADADPLFCNLDEENNV